MTTTSRFLIAGVLAAAGCASPMNSAGSGSATIASGRPNCPPLAALDSARMMSDIFRLAADSMRGRRTGSVENEKARRFIAARLNELKLESFPSGRLDPFSLARTGRGGAAGAPAQPLAPIVGTNVIGFIRGTRFPDRYIVVSAHFDHIGYVGAGSCRAIGADSICNGADDNASGTAALLSMAQHFAANRPSHSIVFAAFDAEESGLSGARAWVDSLPVPIEQVLLNVNMDMIGRNTKNELFAAGATKYPHLKPLVDATIACAPLTLISGHDGEAGRDDWSGQSDQGAFHRRAIPFIYFGEEDHPDYHRAGDHPDRLMPGYYVAAARTVADFVRRYDAAPAIKP
jgi:hypothetical protein